MLSSKLKNYRHVYVPGWGVSHSGSQKAWLADCGLPLNLRKIKKNIELVPLIATSNSKLIFQPSFEGLGLRSVLQHRDRLKWYHKNYGLPGFTPWWTMMWLRPRISPKIHWSNLGISHDMNIRCVTSAMFIDFHIKQIKPPIRADFRGHIWWF